MPSTSEHEFCICTNTLPDTSTKYYGARIDMISTHKEKHTADQDDPRCQRAPAAAYDGSQKSWENGMQFVCDSAERPAGSILQCYWLTFYAHLSSLPYPVSLVSRITDFCLCRGYQHA